MTVPDSRSAQNTNPSAEAGLLARMALALTAWTERWVPDAFVFALLATLIVIVAGVAFTPSSLPQVIDAWGRGLWELIPFTLQMALIIITGHVLATSQPVGRVIRRVGGLADDAAQRRCAGDVLRHDKLMVQLGIQPHLQRRARARNRASRRGRRLSSARRRQLPRPRQHLGARVERIGCPANGHAGSAPAADPGDRRARRHGRGRAHPVQSYDFSLAEPLVGGDGDPRRDDRDVAGYATGRARQDGARSRHRSRPDGDRTAGANRETDSGPVARTFPDPQLADRPPRRHLSGSLFHAGGRAAERDQPEHRQSHLSCSSVFCCTRLRRA